MIETQNEILEAMKNMNHDLLGEQFGNIAKAIDDNKDKYKILEGVIGILEVTHDAYHVMNPDMPDSACWDKSENKDD